MLIESLRDALVADCASSTRLSSNGFWNPLAVCPEAVPQRSSDQSVFSLLLEIETRLRAEAPRDSLLGEDPPE
jgi:hypothetical protein